MKLSDKIRSICIKHLEVGDLTEIADKVALLEDVLTSIHSNYDCDESEHRYHKPWYGPVVHNCRCCAAEDVLKKTEY